MKAVREDKRKKEVLEKRNNDVQRRVSEDRKNETERGTEERQKVKIKIYPKE